MMYTTLGNTGLNVSRLCFGTLTIGPIQGRLSLSQGGNVMAYAMERGINFFDTAQLYETYDYIKYAMDKTNQKDIIISSKTYAYTKEMAVTAVEEARKKLDRDYIDIFMLHEQESIHTLNGHRPALEQLMEYKSKGVIKAVGLSTHHIAGVYGGIEKELDIIHPLINYKGLGIVDGSLDEMEKAISLAFKQGMGVFAMKALGGGNLFKEAEKCLKYVLDQPFIHSVAIGMQSIDEVDANIEFFEHNKFSPKAQIKLNAKKRHLHIDDWCSACGNCVDRCGQNALYLDNKMAKCDENKCILCGYCSTVCPMWAIKML